MKWIRNGTLMSAKGVEVDLSSRNLKNWITIKGENSKMTEKIVQAILDCLNDEWHGVR